MSTTTQTPTDALHAAVCQAVALMNVSPEIARSADGREAHTVLRQALVEFADRELARNWRPIEAAPRDGTRVLLYDAQRVPAEMIARFRHDAWLGDRISSGRFEIWRDTAGAFWMPLPAPPKGEAA